MSRILAGIGRFSARHRIIVITAWILVLAAFTGVYAAASSGDKPESSVTMTETDATRALDTLQKEFPTDEAPTPETLQLVIQAPSDGFVTEPAAMAAISSLLTDASKIEGIETVSDPFAAQNPYVSASGTTAVSTLTLEDLSEDQKHDTYDAVTALADDAPSGLQVDVGGNLFADGAPAPGAGEIVGVLIAFLVLFLTFGSLLAAGANLLVAVSGIAVGTLGVLAYGAINPIQDTTLTLGTMLGLAVGIDYSLFILTRFRTELRAGRNVEDAVARAVGTAGTAVVFAGLTVIIALAGLSVVGISFITEMGVAGAFSVLIAVLMALTLLPVLLKSLGRNALPKKERRLDAATLAARYDTVRKTGFLRRWGSFVVKRPVVSIVGGVIVLLVIALPMVSMKTASNVPGGIDPASTQRAAYNEIVDEFGGVQSPLLVLAQGDQVSDHLNDLESTLNELDNVQMVIPGTTNVTGDAALLTVIPSGSPIDTGTKDLVHAIRSDADAIAGVHLEVTGETAIGIDQDAALQQALITYLIVIVALSLVLLIIMFRSLLVPLIATLGFLLSVGASFGASVAVFQWGWLDPIINAPQGDPMLSILPIILVGVLFGLAMDYQVFLVSKIKEMHDGGMPARTAIVEGFSRSAPVLVAAAAIMAVVFAGFASSEMAVAASIAFGLVVGVLADAFIVRLILMPALLSLLGNSAWWLPSWLDRVIPKLDMEGHSLDAVADPTSNVTEPERELAGV